MKSRSRAFAAIVALLLLVSGILLASTTALIQSQGTGGIWTQVASTCAVIQGSTDLYETAAARFRHGGENIGEIYTRCNVTNPLDDGGNPDWSLLEVVYFDQDGQSESYQVTAELVRVSNSSGGIYTLATFDSNDFVESLDAQTRTEDFNDNFDFSEFAYYVEIKVVRENATNNPAVSIVRLRQGP